MSESVRGIGGVGLETATVLGFQVARSNPDETARRVLSWKEETGEGLTILALNPAKVAMAGRSPPVHDALGAADLLIPDGIGVCHAARLLESTRVSRLTGVDLAFALLRRLEHSGGRVFLLGARPDANHAAVAAVRRRFPGLGSVDGHHGFFSEPGYDVLSRIRDARPDVLLVGLGSPRQELWIHEHAHEIPCVAVGVGGTIDILAGRARRVSPVVQRLGVEWVVRVALSPSRIPRLLRSHPPFFALVVKRLLRRLTAGSP